MLCIMQTDSRVNDHSYGDRVANEGLMLVSGAVLQDKLQTVIKEAKAAAAEEHIPKPDPVTSAAPKADTPQHPAARAGGDGGRGDAKKGKKPAAQASEKPKTSAAHASAQIAEALQELEGSGAAAAAQGIEGVPVAVAQAPISGAKAQGNKAAPVAPKAAHGLPPASEIEDDFPYPNDDAQQPADAQAATANNGRGSAGVKSGATLGTGLLVQVNESATGKKQKPWIGYYGTIAAQVGADAWEVDIERTPRCKPLRVCFHQSELEASE